MGACYKSNEEYEWSLRFGQNLQKVLQSRNITQGILARKLGSTDAMISRYIYGTSVPSIYKVRQMANIIGCSISELMDV